MPRRGRRSPVSFTLIVVPHSQRPSFAVRIPFWAIYVGLALLMVGIARLAFFAYEYQETAGQLARLRQGGQMALVRQGEMQKAIAAQAEQILTLRTVENEEIAALRAALSEQATAFNAEVARYDEEVAVLSSQLNELELFKAEIRHIVGLDKETSAPTLPAQAAPDRQPETASAATAATVSPAADTGEQGTSAAASTASGGKPGDNGSLAAASSGQNGAPGGIGPLNAPHTQRAAENVTSRGGTPAAGVQATVQNIGELQKAASEQLEALDALKQQVGDRVSKVQGQWTDPKQLTQQLSLYDAAPRAWPVTGRIYSRFGYDASRIAVGANPNHKGVDIPTAYGTAVLAPQDGVVTYVGPNGTLGQTVEIRHDLGWSTLYAHLQLQVPVKIGERVKLGQTIGYVGMTGYSTGPHLHYEIHLNGTPIDPEKYLGK